MSHADYQVWILDPTMARLAVLDQYVSFTWTRNLYTPHSFELHASRYAAGAEYLVQDNLIQVWRNGAIEFTAVIEFGELALDQTGKLSETWKCMGGDIISRRICLPPTGQDYDVRSGAAETVMKGYVTANVISPTDANRTINMVTNEADSGRGTSIQVSARYDSLPKILEECGRAGGLGWELVATATGLQFKIIPGVDRSTDQSTNPPIIFSPDFGNIQVLDYQWSMLGRATLAYVAGQGVGSARLVQTAYQGTEPTGLARREQFIDARDLSVAESLVQRGLAKLGAQGPLARLDGQILTSGPYRYRVDWDLGDTVTVRELDWGVTAILPIASVTVTLQAAANGQADEQIAVAFGQAAATLLSVIGQGLGASQVAQALPTVPVNASGSPVLPNGSISGSALASALSGKDLTGSTGLTVDSPTLVVDAVNHRVGVGVASPAMPLHVAGQLEVDVPNNTSQGMVTTDPNTHRVVVSPSNGLTGVPYVGTTSSHSLSLGTSGNESMRLLTNGNVGVGTASPAVTLDVNGKTVVRGTITGISSPNGYTEGDGVVAESALANAKRVYMVTRDDLNGSIGAGQIAYVQSGVAWGPILLSPYSSVAISMGTALPAYALDVGGACHASSFPTSSDMRFKDKVAPLSTGILDKVRRLRGVSFEWNKHYSDLGRKGQPGRNIGFIAQELEQEFPEVVSKWGEGDPKYEHAAEQYRGVDYGRMVPVLLEAIKELASANDALTARVSALEAEMAAVKTKLGI